MADAFDVLDAPMYSPVFVARLVGLRPERVRRWLRGYEYTYAPSPSTHAQRRKKGPVVSRSGAEGSRYASFLDLIDLLFCSSKFLIDTEQTIRYVTAKFAPVPLASDSHLKRENPEVWYAFSSGVPLILPSPPCNRQKRAGFLSLHPCRDRGQED